jgi:SAM-dependent methyltransferase
LIGSEGSRTTHHLEGLSHAVPMFLRENEIGGRLAPWLTPGTDVLDLGSGTGQISRWLAKRIGIRPAMADVVEFGNRVGGYPYIRLDDPFRVPVDDGSFDAVMLLFVLHHVERWGDQERLLREAIRITRSRLLILEDTPASPLERRVNAAWDWALNLRHGVPRPFTFRTAEGWTTLFRRSGLSLTRRETYRAKWPSLMTYRHTLFVMDRIPSSRG